MSKNTKFHIGCSGFYNRHWKGSFYPTEMPQREWLAFYAEHLSSLELNSTFYKFPTVRVMQNWNKKCPEKFIISVKAPRIITHLKKFNDCTQLIHDFYTACDGLGEKLGCTLFQLPPSFHFSEDKLQLVIKSLDPSYKNVIEFRHPSWWNQQVYAELSKAGIIFCSASHPSMPGDLVINMPTVYLRLHGIPDMFYSNYADEYLKKLRDNIRGKKGIGEAFIYFNNTAGLAGIQNALQLTKMI